jgi:Tol biopolymer transport system component
MRLWIYISFLLIITVFLAAQGEIRVGAKPTRLLGDESNARMNPIWSPDGTMLAFTSPNYVGLWVMEADGSNVRQISDELSAGYGFEWAPDSQELIYRVTRYDGYRRFTALKMFDFSINESRQISDFKLKLTGSAHWNSDSQKIVLLGRNGIEEIDTGMNRSKSSQSAPSKNICFMQDLQIYLYDPSDQSTAVIDPLPGSRYLDATMSPDGRYIAFQVVGENMFVIGIAGSGLIDLGRGYRPRWSPDSKQLIYMICKDDGYQFTGSDLYIIDRSGQNKQQITDTPAALEMNPVWSPDGKKIAYDRMDQGAIYVLEVVE